MDDFASLVISVDTRSINAANEALFGLSRTSKSTEVSAQSFTAKMKRQSETLGLSAGEVRRFDAAQLKLNSTQRASVDASLRSIDAYEKQNARLSILRGGLALAGVAAAAFTTKLITGSVGASSRFETALIGVAKTTGLAGQELDDFADRIDKISRSIPVTTDELLELSQAAGQMGVTGSENLEKFAVTVAKLGRASDLAGEQAASALARILNVTGENVDSIDILASVIVSLGNNVAATESQIARMTTEIARSTSVFGVSSAEAAAMGAAMASIGIQAELGGSSVGRVMQEITSRVQEGGSSLADFADTLNLNADTLTKLFQDNKVEAFQFFLERVGDLGLDAGNALDSVGLGGQEIAKTIIPLSNNMGIFTETLRLANAEVANATALDREYEASLGTLSTQWQVTKNIVESYARSIGEVLVPALNQGLLALNNFFGAGEDADPIQKQVKLIEDLDAKIKSLKSRNSGLDGVIPGASRLFGTNKRELDELEASLENSTEDLFKMIDAQAALGQESKNLGGAIKPLVKPIRDLGEGSKGASGGVDGLTKSLKDQIEAGKQFVSSLEKEKAQLGKTAIEIRKMEARSFGLADSKDRLIDEIEQERISLKALEDDLAKVESITESVATAEEKFAARQKELNRLVVEGGLSAETYTRALEKSREELFDLEDGTDKATKRIEQFWIQANRNIQSSLADGIFNFFDNGLKGMVKGVISTIGRITSEFAALRLLQGVGFGGLALGSGAASASGGGFSLASAGLSAANLFSSGISSGFGLNSILSKGAIALGDSFGISALSSFGAGLGTSATGVAAAEGAAALYGTTGLSSAAGLGSGLGAIAGPAALAFAATQIFESLAGDKRVGGGLGKAINFVGDLPIIGNFLPSVPLINGIFGRGPLKQKETNLIGDFNAEGFEGVTSVKFKAKGGLARGNKVDRIINDTDSGELLNEFRGIRESGISSVLDEVAEGASKAAIQLGRFLDTSVKGFSTSLRDAAGVLGLGVESIDNFSSSINIASKKGEELSQEQIAEELAKVSNELATGLIPAVGELGENGESAFDTVIRLASQTQGLINALTILGDTSDEAKNKILGIDFSERSDIVDQFGGLDALNSQFQFFFDNALSGAEQLEFFTTNLGDSLTKAGFSADLTVEEFNNLILTMNEVGGIGLEAASKLLPLGPALYQVRDAADQIVQSQQARNNRLIDIFATPTEKIGILQNKLAEGLSKLGLATDLTFEEVNNLARAEYAASDGASELLDGLDALIPIYLQLTGITEDYNKSLQDQRDIIAASKDQASSLSDSLLNTLSDRLFDDLEADRKNAIDTAKSELDGSFALLRRSITAQKDALKTQFDLDLETVADRISGVSDSVRDLSRLSDVLRDSTNRFNPVSVNEARGQIRSAIGSVASGGSVDVDRVRQAISALENQSTSGFTNSLDFAKEQIKSSALIGKLASVTGGQLTLEERSLAALEAQRDRLTEGFDRQVNALDGILSNAQSQLNALNGIKDGVTSTGNALSIFSEALINSRNVADLTPIIRPAEIVPSIPEVTNQQITDYVAANIDNPFDLYTKALEFGLTTERVANNTDLFTIEEANKFQSENKLINLDIAAELKQGNKDNEADNKAILKLLGELKTAIENGNLSADKTANLLRGAVIGDQPLKTEAAA